MVGTLVPDRLSGEPAGQYKTLLLEWLQQARGLIDYANDCLGKTSCPDFWYGVRDAEQERIRQITVRLIEIKRTWDNDYDNKEIESFYKILLRDIVYNKDAEWITRKLVENGAPKKQAREVAEYAIEHWEVLVKK